MQNSEEGLSQNAKKQVQSSGMRNSDIHLSQLSSNKVQKPASTMQDEKELLAENLSSKHTISVKRYLHTLGDVQGLYGKDTVPLTSGQKIKNFFKCSGPKCLQLFLAFFPFIGVLRTYKIRKYLLADILSGVTAACLHFPQGLAFGLLASLAPAFGLYTSFFPILLYMIFGTSHHTSFGTNAVIALFTAEIVEGQVIGLNPRSSVANMTGNATQDVGLDEAAIMDIKVMAASGASLIVGILLLAMGILRLGFITSYLSSSFIHAFVCASAVHIASSQLPKALGISIPSFTGPGKLVLSYVEIFKAIPKVNIASLIIAILSLVILLLVKECVNKRFKDRMKMPIPIDLILIVVATIISHFAGFRDKFAVPVVGNIPTGIPAPRLPVIDSSFAGTAIVVAILVFVLSIAMARTCELKHDYQIDDNQELIAYGISNIGSSFFQCFPSCTAPPRTMLLSLMGAKTTLNGLFSGIVMLLVLLVVGQLFTSLPLPVLSAMVIVAVKDLLLHVTELPNFWRMNRYDFVIWIATCACGVFIDIPYALYAGVAVGLLTVVIQSQLAASYSLLPSETEDIYLDTTAHHNLKNIPNIHIFRMESSLYFATADIFKRKLYKEVGDPRKPSKTTDSKANESRVDTREGDGEAVNYYRSIKYIIIDCSLVCYIDMNGMKILAQIAKEFKKTDITVVLARCSKSVQQSLKKSLLSSAFPESRVFLELNDAVFACKNSLI